MQEVLLLSVVTASIAFTVAETKLFQRFREWAAGKSSFLGAMSACGYCLGHWIAFALVAAYPPRLFESWWPLDYFLTALVVAWLGGVQWALMCLLMKAAGK